MTSLIRILVLAIVVFAFAAGDICSQSNAAFNQRDDQYRLLGLKRARELFESARSNYERQEELFEKGHISTRELEQSRERYADAEVNYHQSLLAVLFERQYISVSKAVKIREADGSKRVRLTLVNASGGGEEYQKLLGIDDQLFRSLQPDVTHNVYVSLLNDEGAIISQPYEAKIAQLRHGEPQSIEFRLLQDVDDVTVSMVYGSGSTRSMKIFLQKDASENRVAVQSDRFSQEVDLGKSTVYDLNLELFSGQDNTFSLAVVNLPVQIGRFFKVAGGNTRLSRVKFTESSRTKRAELEVTLPDRPSDQVAMDQPITFYVLAVPPDKAGLFSQDSEREWTAEELEQAGVGYARLELLPRGTGELSVRSPQLLHTTEPGETVIMSMEVFNEGSRRLDNVEFQVDLPPNWTREISPERIGLLEIGKDQRVLLSITPPADVSPGKYQVRVRTTATSGNQPVKADDKTATIEVRGSSSVFGTIIVVLLIVGLVAGIVVWGVRLSRR